MVEDAGNPAASAGGEMEQAVPYKYMYIGLRCGWRRARRFVKYRILHVDDAQGYGGAEP